MLQIVGWLGCVYLFVKAFEIGSSSAHRDEKGEVNSPAAIAIAVSAVASIGFAVWILLQGAAIDSASPYGSLSSYDSSYSDDEAAAAADAAMADVEANIEAAQAAVDSAAADAAVAADAID